MQNTIRAQLQHIINNKTKPLGSLGVLEDLALQIGTIQQSINPTITEQHVVVFAGDHGIAATGLVNPFPQAVTAQMVLNFVKGGAAINAFCKVNHTQLSVVDCGVNFEFDTQLPILHKKIALGTNNYLQAKAMSLEQVHEAIENGKHIVQQIVTKANTHKLAFGFGEMGIGNTSSSSLIMHYYTKFSLQDCVGKGTGVNHQQLEIKLNTLQQVAVFHNLNNNYTATELLSKIGGFEIATMVGAYLQAQKENTIIVVDGFIATAALMVAKDIEPTVINNCIFSHSSGEKGHAAMLTHLQVKPLLQLGLRLGEGTGAALAFPILQAACTFVNEMASFDDLENG
jgi:nicotinate-nucleotide--dimethylbenzimidazole phosphoribosyltransferase